jgi:hypothetical protein
MKGRITMDDVARDKEKWKGELTRALDRLGSIQLRLNEFAAQYEKDAKEYARKLREDAGTLVATVVDVPNPVPADTLANYAVELRYISECKANLRTLRVPESEIEKILKG